jgi:hypothetical protein
MLVAAFQVLFERQRESLAVNAGLAPHQPPRVQQTRSLVHRTICFFHHDQLSTDLSLDIEADKWFRLWLRLKIPKCTPFIGDESNRSFLATLPRLTIETWAAGTFSPRS